MNDKEFAKAQASIMNKKTKLVQLKDDRAEACKKINEIEQEIAKTENELLEEENKFILLCGQKSQLMRERALQVGAEINEYQILCGTDRERSEIGNISQTIYINSAMPAEKISVPSATYAGIRGWTHFMQTVFRQLRLFIYLKKESI